MQKNIYSTENEIHIEKKTQQKTVSFVGGSCFITKLHEKTKQTNGWRQQMVLINMKTIEKSISSQSLN